VVEETSRTGIGYCSTASQVFVGLSLAAGLWVREWQVFFDDFGGSAHVFDEIYDRQRDKWVMVDPLYSFIPRDAATQTPLSVREFLDALASGRQREVAIHFIRTPRAKTAREVFSYYGPGVERAALNWGNAEITYDRSALATWLQPLPIRVQQLVRIAIGDYPVLMARATPAVKRDWGAVRELRTLSLAVISAAFTCALLLAHALLLLKQQPSPRAQAGRSTPIRHSARETWRPSPTRARRSTSRPNSG
jgi:hypothetical protein